MPLKKLPLKKSPSKKSSLKKDPSVRRRLPFTVAHTGQHVYLNVDDLGTAEMSEKETLILIAHLQREYAALEAFKKAA